MTKFEIKGRYTKRYERAYTWADRAAAEAHRGAGEEVAYCGSEGLYYLYHAGREAFRANIDAPVVAAAPAALTRSEATSEACALSRHNAATYTVYEVEGGYEAFRGTCERRFNRGIACYYNGRRQY